MRTMPVGEAEGLHRPVPQRLAPAFRHDLDGQAAVEIRRRLLPIAERNRLAGQKAIDEGFVLLARSAGS